MPRMKPDALLQHSKRKKGPAKLSAATLVIVGVVLILLLLSALVVHKQKSKGGMNTRDDFINQDISWTKGSDEKADLKAGDDQVPRFATLNTTRGLITVELFPKDAPKTVENFITHSKNGYYNGVIFHRVIKNFVIQAGDPKGDGSGGDSIWGGSFRDEFQDGLKHEAFVLSMANAGPNTNRSQFFITTVPLPHLNNRHTVFGRVVRGREVVQEIERVDTNPEDRPLVPVVIHSITVADEL